MSLNEENQVPEWNNRWYDRDPALKHAIDQLRFASDDYQAQIALNIIKIIVEHQIELETCAVTENFHPAAGSQGTVCRHRRWYDVQETLSSAMQLLADCPSDLKRKVLPSITRMIEEVISAQEI